VGYFYQAALFQSKMMDYETDRWEKEFYDFAGRAIELGERQIEFSRDPWIFFYLGSAYGYKGLYQAKSGSLISGFLSAHKGLGYLKKALELDSTLYDAHLALGSYKYWSGRFYKYLRWLPFISDDRKEGLAEVRLAVDRGRFSYWVGLNGLAWIEYDRGRFSSALALFDQGLAQYPESRFFIWGRADCLFRLNRFAEAGKEYEALLSSIMNAEVPSPYNEVSCRFKLVQCDDFQKKYPEALAQAETILALKADSQTAKRIHEHVKKAKEYRDRCLEVLGRPVPKDDKEPIPIPPH
jgi:tetratricopeptide (TPR) repeat protein